MTVTPERPPGPELFFGLVSAVGSPTRKLADSLKLLLDNSYSYPTEIIRVSKFLQDEGYLQGIELDTPAPAPGASEFSRINQLMSRGNELREKYGEGALAAFISADVITHRTSSDATIKAYIFDQLKHPEEVYALRGIYGDAFHVIGLYSPEYLRHRHLVENVGMNCEDATHLIERDEAEEQDWGQQFRDTFELADFFLAAELVTLAFKIPTDDLERFLDLLMGDRVITPTEEEYGMALASTAAERSASLSRQVGAAIVAPYREVISLGCNEVPRRQGGQYWGDEDFADARDHALGVDSNDQKKEENLSEVLRRASKILENSLAHPDQASNIIKQVRAFLANTELSLGCKNDGKAADDVAGLLEPIEQLAKSWQAVLDSSEEKIVRFLRDALKQTRVMNLTEFGRAVHAEMEALLAAARIGVSVRYATLYTTTFPCHNCAKHIIGAGIYRVVYIEPYPKSLASDLHEDSISLEEEGKEEIDGRREVQKNARVRFDPFIGVAPRRFSDLFSTKTQFGERVKRKDRAGQLVEDALGLRLSGADQSYFEIERIVARKLDKWRAAALEGTSDASGSGATKSTRS